MPLAPHPQRPAFLLIWIGLVTGVTGMVGHALVPTEREIAALDPESTLGNSVEVAGVLVPVPSIQPNSAASAHLLSTALQSGPEDQTRAVQEEDASTERVPALEEVPLDTPSPVVVQPKFPAFRGSFSEHSTASAWGYPTAAIAVHGYFDEDDEEESSVKRPSLRLRKAQNGLVWLMATFEAESRAELLLQMKSFLAKMPQKSHDRIQEDFEEEGSDADNPRARARAVLRELKRKGVFELVAQMTPEEARHMMARYRARHRG